MAPTRTAAAAAAANGRATRRAQTRATVQGKAPWRFYTTLCSQPVLIRRAFALVRRARMNDGKGKDRNERQQRQTAQREAAERRRRRKLFSCAARLSSRLGAAAWAYRLYTQSHLLDAVTTASYRAGLHMAGPIDYTESPPVGGAHNVVWQNCGIYDVPIHNEHAVHSLEHGAVWITYRSDLPPDQVQILKSAASDDFMLLSPYTGLASPVVASAWNHQIRLDGAADPRLQRFIDRVQEQP